MNTPDPQLTLTLELAGSTPSVALALDDQFLCLEPVNDSSPNHDDLIPAINRLFHQHHQQPTDLNEIYISIGPGGFTGLRKSVTTAKMLALTSNAKILPIPTAEILAQAVPLPSPVDPITNTTPRLLVSLASKRGSSWCTTFNPSPHPQSNLITWSQFNEPSFLNIIDYAQSVTQPLIITGDLPPETMQSLQTQNNITYQPPNYSAKHAWQVGRFHRNRIQRGLATWTPAAQLIPFYGREPEAVRLWKNRTKTK